MMTLDTIGMPPDYFMRWTLAVIGFFRNRVHLCMSPGERCAKSALVTVAAHRRPHFVSACRVSVLLAVAACAPKAQPDDRVVDIASPR